MAQSARLTDGAAALRAFAPRPRNERDAQRQKMDWDLARLTKANLLLVGAEQTVSNLVFAMWSVFEGPIVTRSRGARLDLPPPEQPAATLIVHGVETLTGDEQGALSEWLEGRGRRTRVVSTAGASLMPMVQTHRFSPALYYRLNTIWIDMTER